ncbi:MAG: PH domain-containing protein [Candidatus Uhrbacteria bacterium]|nr:PH domain-containing protein [Candidatus Uhrbacteria bacterium]MDP3793582.1 PH domain-containing protein [Candidatus Uhrbacteria bacterium]
MSPFKSLHLKEGERVEAVVRKHGITLLPGLFSAAFLIVTPFFFLFPILQLGLLGKIFLVACEIAGCWFAVRSFLIWNFDVLIVTGERLIRIEQQGIWKRRRQEIPLSLIRDIGCERSGLIEIFWPIGTLWVRTSVDAPRLAATRIPHPEDWQRYINALREKQQEKIV